MRTLSIIIPVYNEERFIKATVELVRNADSLGLQKEIIIVDDASTDTTGDIVQSFRSDTSITLLKHTENRGKGAAVKTGLLASTGDIVLIQDADLEYSPDDIPLVIEPFLKKQADVVYGSRFISHRPHRVLYFWHGV